MSGFLEFTFSIMLLAIFVFIFFAPTFIASRCDHKRRTSIFILNLLGGWTGILWFAALVWALNEDW